MQQEDQEATKGVLSKWITKCEVLRDNLNRKAEKVQSIEVLKLEIADFKVNSARKFEAIEKMGKLNDQLLQSLSSWTTKTSVWPMNAD